MSHTEVACRSTFTIEVYRDVSAVRPNFDALDHAHQQTVLDKLEPLHTETTHNVASTVFLEYLVDVIDQNQTLTDQDPERFALGTGDSSPSSSDTALDNEVGEITIGTVTDNGTTLTMEGTIGESELNGNTLREIAVTNNNAFFYNRALIGPIAKTSDESVNITGEFTFTAQ